MRRKQLLIAVTSPPHDCYLKRAPCDPANSSTVIMTSGLIGIFVIVTLRNPPNTIVQGLVAAVNPQTSTLTLQDGMEELMSLRDGHQLTYFSTLPGNWTSAQ
jgi:hypothetical protein